jgi:dihydroneopterin aldolase
LDTIFIECIEFYGYHGASDEEQSVGHRYAVDAEMRFDTRKAGGSDSLRDTVNYSTVAKRVVAIGTHEQHRLLESLAARLAEVILAEFPVESVRLRVRKIRPPMNVIAAAVGVEIERHKERG